MNAALREWKKIPAQLERITRGLTRKELDARGGDDGWSIRENVHHLVEANLVASNMILAALGTDEYLFDWDWLIPDEQWMERLGYRTADLRPAIELFAALTAHIAALVARKPALLSRKIRLRSSDQPEPYKISVEGILKRELEHAQGHLAQVRAIRKQGK